MLRAKTIGMPYEDECIYGILCALDIVNCALHVESGL